MVPLGAGGTICIPPSHDTLLDPRTLVDWVDHSGIRLVHCVPTLFSTFVKGLPTAAKLESLEYVLLAGEVVPVGDVKQWMDRFENRVKLVNLYGPTETTMIKFCHVIQRKDVDRGFIPIGTPIEGAKAVILDSAGNPCPQGTSGEIHIRTPYRTSGYYRQAELTRQVFIQNPFNNNPRDLIDRTGDIGRVLHDGNFQFVGRKDLQVKIRGVRIELGEIETALQSHPAVQRAVVVAREDSAADKSLVGFVMAAEGEDPTISSLRRWLQVMLPHYMVPTAFVVLDELPLTANGKVNRRALPRPASARPQLEELYQPPRTPTEHAVARIWCAVLSLDQVGVHDSFFELGGHSLLATQVLSRVREHCQCEVPLGALFQESTIANLSTIIDRSHNTDPTAALPQIHRADRDQELPLSFSQQRLWFLDQLVPGEAFSNMPTTVRLTGRLDYRALKRSLNEIVRRHESLRTNFTSTVGRPRQVVTPTLNLTLSLIDLSGLSEHDCVRQARRLTDEEAQRPFNLVEGPLVRAVLLRLETQQHDVLFTTHHIVFDAWSRGIVAEEVATLYDAFARGNPSPLPELKIQYVDYSLWQRDWLQGEVLNRQLTYWEERLKDLPPLRLPTDRPRPAAQTFRGSRYYVQLPGPLCQPLRELGRREGTTLFMTLLAAFQVLLARYCGQEDIAVGVPIAGRNSAETERLVGLFVNSLVMRCNLAGNPQFRELLRRVRDACLGAYAHQDLPFEKFVAELQPDRDLSREPLFQVLFMLQNLPRHPDLNQDRRTSGTVSRKPDGLEVTPVGVEMVTAKYDLSFFVWEGTESLLGYVEYSTDLFDRETIVGLVEQFRTLLEGIVANPERRVSELPNLTAEARRQVIAHGVSSKLHYPGRSCIHELFETHASRTPDAVAAACGDDWISYRELNLRSNQLAHHFRNRGIGCEVPVAVCLDRSFEMLISILGILKAGGVYVPLDPSYPRERLDFMLADTKAKLVVTKSDFAGQLPVADCDLVCLDTDRKLLANESTVNSKHAVEPTSLAHVMYTSGSTGQPKGVAVTHQGVVRLVFATNGRRTTEHQSGGSAANAMGAADPGSTVTETIPVSLLHLSSSCFDASTYEIWAPLLSGGSCILFPRRVPTVHELAAAIARYGVRTQFLTTSLFNTIVEMDPDCLANIEELWVGGEVMSAAHVRRAMDLLPAMKLINVYGPTENTAFSSCYTVLPESTSARDSIPIGRPIPNTQMYLVDRYLNPVALGGVGELYLGGDGLARGYVNQSGLAAERFIPNPFGSLPGQRLYRSGDYGRWLRDANLRFLGRGDHQVKIRGFRIEVGETEAVVATHPRIEQAVVVADEVNSGERRLVAFVVPRTTAGAAVPTTEGILSYLLSKLPEYMVSATLVIVSRLPAMPNGKVDRSKLPMPRAGAADPKNYVAPRNRVERELLRLWTDVLGAERIGVRENFFDLGGDSILSIQLVARAHQRNLRLTPQQVFEHQTIERLAAVVQVGPALPSDQRPVSGAVTLTPIQQWFFQEQAAAPHHFNQAFLFQVTERLETVHLHAAIEQLIVHHDALRLRFRTSAGTWVQENAGIASVERLASTLLRAVRGAQPHGPYLLAGHSAGGTIAFELARQLRAQGQQVQRLVIFDMPTPRRQTESDKFAVGDCREVPIDDSAQLLSGLANSLGRAAGKSVQVSVHELRSLDFDR